MFQHRHLDKSNIIEWGAVPPAWGGGAGKDCRFEQSPHLSAAFPEDVKMSCTLENGGDIQRDRKKMILDVYVHKHVYVCSCVPMSVCTLICRCVYTCMHCRKDSENSQMPSAEWMKWEVSRDHSRMGCFLVTLHNFSMDVNKQIFLWLKYFSSWAESKMFSSKISS